MRTTVRLNQRLLERAKREARRRHITLTALLEEGLDLALANQLPVPKVRVSLPVCSACGGTLPGIDLNDTAALLNALDAHP